MLEQIESWFGFQTVKEYEGMPIDKLPINHAYTYVNTSIKDVTIYELEGDCFNCPFKRVCQIESGTKTWCETNIEAQRWRILRREDKLDYIDAKDRDGWICELTPNLKEYGVYSFDVGTCEVKEEVAPVNTYLALIICSAILLGLFFIYYLVKYIYNKRERRRDNREKAVTLDITIENQEPNENNLKSLHVFRDILLILIIFTTTGGGGYPVFNQELGGLSIAECLFFAFLWTVGFKTPTVLSEACNKQSRRAIFRDIFMRSLFLVFLGTAIGSSTICSYSDYNIPLWAPLQRIGISYLVVSVLYVITAKKSEIKSQPFFKKVLNNITSLLCCWILTGILSITFIVLTWLLVSNNCFGGINIEHGLDYNSTWEDVTRSCNNNTVSFNRYFVADDRNIVDVNRYLVFSRGLMGLLSTVICSMMGLKAGVIYSNYQYHADRLKLWTFWGTVFGACAVLIAVVSYPLRFNLWPLAVITAISTLTLYLISIIYIFVAIWKYTKFSSSEPASSVSLLVLTGHLLLSRSLPFSWNLVIKSHLVYLLQNYWIIFLWLIIAAILKKKLKCQIRI